MPEFTIQEVEANDPAYNPTVAIQFTLEDGSIVTRKLREVGETFSCYNHEPAEKIQFGSFLRSPTSGISPIVGMRTVGQIEYEEV